VYRRSSHEKIVTVSGIISSSRMMIWLCWKRRQHPNKCRLIWTTGWTLALDFAKYNAGPSRASFSCCQTVIIFAEWCVLMCMDVYGSFTLYDGTPNRAHSMVLQSMQPVRVYAWGLYCLIVSNCWVSARFWSCFSGSAWCSLFVASDAVPGPMSTLNHA